jgi:myosin heavy subunit
MVDETDMLDGPSEEEKQKPVQSSGEVTLGLEQSQQLTEEGHAPPWLRMDPELSRTVLSKTEEELLGALAALMRNKIEYEKAQRALANTILEIEQAKRDVAGVRRQVSAAEDELSTRLADHERVVAEIAQSKSELQEERSKYLEFQNELIAIRNEIEQAQREKVASSEELAEVQRQQRAVLAEIESLKSEVAALNNERQITLQRVEPIRQELDERLVAREALIQQITTMEEHIAQLTSTRDIRTNAQRIALVGRGTESMREEIQQLKAEIDRIEKERIRLAQERDMVESEFAGLQGRLSSARSTYAETLERLDEARAALAVTEKEHDDAVSKLVHVHEQGTKPSPESTPSAEERRQPEEVLVNEENLLAQESMSAEQEQGLPLKESMNEPLLGESTQEPALDQPIHEPVLQEPARESVHNEPVTLESEPRLPLLVNEPLPAVTSTWDSYRLESEFFTEETLDANRVAHLVSELPGIENVLVVRQRGAVLAGGLPERLRDHLQTSGRDYERLFSDWPNRTQERKSASTQIVTLQIGDEFLTAAQANDIFLVVSHERPKLHPGVEEKLTVVAEELDKMYPRAGNGIQETGVGSL